MTNMREKIAERLMRHYAEGGPWDGFMEADIVLDVLLEPTEGMREAAMDVLLHRGDIYQNGDGNIVIETITPRDLMQAMIRAAKEGN